MVLFQNINILAYYVIIHRILEVLFKTGIYLLKANKILQKSVIDAIK